MINKQLIFALGISSAHIFGQVGINTTTPHPSSALEVNSNQKGLLLPRLSTKSIEDLTATATEGLVLYDTDKKIFVGFNGQNWLNLSYSENNTPPYFTLLPTINSSNKQIPAILPANYILSDNDSADQNLTAKYRWLKADNPNGLSSTITTNIQENYSTSISDKNKYLQVCVLPISATGATPGIEKCSPWFGPMLEFAPTSVSLISWEFNGITGYGSSPMMPTNIDPQITAEGLERATGLKTTGTVAAANAWGANAWDQNTLADAILNNDFITFAIKPNPGKIISITKISAHNLRKSPTGPSFAQWQYSTDAINYTNIGPENSLNSTVASGNSISEINLSNISNLQNIDSSKNIYFRLLGYGGTGGTFYINNLSGLDLELMGEVQ